MSARQRLRAGRGQWLALPTPPPFPLESDPESWCRKHAVSEAALQLAGAVRTELLDVMQRIELPVSPPAFGTDSNILQLKRALLTGFFLKVEPSLPQADGGVRQQWPASAWGS